MSLQLYPIFNWDEFFWVTTIELPTWSGFQVRNGPYGALSSSEKSTGLQKVTFAPEGRGDDPLNSCELKLVEWFIQNEKEIHDSLLECLFQQYPDIKEEFSDYLEEEAVDLLPEITSPIDLKNIIGVVSFNIHQVSKDGIPYIGVELGCTWDDEHGLGILMHGTEAIEIGGADTACLLWIAKRHAKAF